MEQENQPNPQIQEFSRIIPIWEFVLLSFATFGIYQLVWFYRNWTFLKAEKRLNISPILRALFSSLFAGSLASHLKKYLKEKNSPCNYSAILIGISYFLLSILWKLPDPYWLITFFTFLPMLPLEYSMNTYWQREDPNLPIQKYNWWQIVLIILGMILVVASIISAFIPENV